jgi:hypothetical protein
MQRLPAKGRTQQAEVRAVVALAAGARVAADFPAVAATVKAVRQMLRQGHPDAAARALGSADFSRLT